VLKEPGRGCDILPGRTRKILGKTLPSFLLANGLGARILCFTFVQTDLNSAAEFRILQPFEGKQGSLDAT
jgi:hypothetical protein